MGSAPLVMADAQSSRLPGSVVGQESPELKQHLLAPQARVLSATLSRALWDCLVAACGSN